MLEQKASCPICKSARVKIYHNKIWSLDRGKVLYCEACDFLFIDLLMTQNEEAQFYKNYGKHIVARGGIQTSDNPEELYKVMLPPADVRLKYIGEYFKPPSDVLEIGASAGSFLGVLLQQGFSSKNLTAVEPSDGHREYVSKYLDIDTYADLKALSQGRQYDVICMFHVFEHIAEPKTFFSKLRSQLKKDGRFIVEVPSHTDALLKLYNLTEFKNFYFQPMHPYVYSPQSIKHVLENNGFVLEKVIPYQRYGLDNHLNWLAQKASGGNRAYADIFSGTANTAYKQALEKAGLSDTIFAIAYPANQIE